MRKIISLESSSSLVRLIPIKKYISLSGQSLDSLIGKTIVAPSSEAHIYEPAELKIRSLVTLGSGKVRIHTNSPLKKNGSTIFSRGFFANESDPDSVYNKFLVREEINTRLTKPQISAENSQRDATHCASCGKALVAVFGTMRVCPICEGD